MASLFEYQALNPSGKSQKGMIEAETLKAARLKLKKQGFMVTQMTEKTASQTRSASFSLFHPIRTQELALTTRQLASLVKANIPLVEAFNALVEQTENARLKIILSQV